VYKTLTSRSISWKWGVRLCHLSPAVNQRRSERQQNNL